ncbi:MAG TPA: hypothetical protein VGX91_11880 [Candidatus Cybelea sp.]|nr:hypothetical protein [Candidatus Cybelea sp.]
MRPRLQRLSYLFALTLAAGCGGRAPASDPGSALLPETERAVRGAPMRSWMLPEAKTEELLYVSNYFSGEVDVYKYGTSKLVGTLTGLNAPGGACSDAAGDVFVTEVRGASITEFAHGGTSPIATLVDTSFYPNDCAVDPTTGDLAVANLDGVPNPGNLAIYKHARGTPAFYYDRNRYIAYYYSCAYDADGNAYVDASFDGGGLVVDELPVGARSLTRLRYPQHPFGSAMGWDGRHVTLGDDGNRLYRFTAGPDRKRVYKEGRSVLQNAAGGLSEVWFQPHGGGMQVVGTASVANAVQIWAYPSGKLLVTVGTGFDDPDGVTVSR